MSGLRPAKPTTPGAATPVMDAWRSTSVAGEAMDVPALISLLLQQDVFEELHRTRIVRLTEPEHRLLADLRITMAARDLDQARHPFVGRHLAEREHRLLLHLGIGIVLHGAGDGGEGLAAGALGEPEQRLATDLAALIVLRRIQQRLQRRWRLADRQAERDLVAHFLARVLRDH